jgi:hypothetical protein
MPEGMRIDPLDAGQAAPFANRSWTDASSPLYSGISPTSLSGILLLVNTGFYQLVTLASDVSLE